jgi:Protein of unknown function (DUF2511)
VSEAEFGDRWPLTVNDGVLVCDQSRSALGAVLFETRGTRYAVNGTTKGLRHPSHPPIDPIWKYDRKPLTTFSAVEPIPETDRKRWFSELVSCQDARSDEADDDVCSAEIRRRHRLTAKELSQISDEGVALTWPPLSPRRVNIGPLIARGLALCVR